MRLLSVKLVFLFLVSCNNVGIKEVDQDKLSNPQVREYSFLECMYQDSYFPTFLTDKCKNVLLELCYKIETEEPSDLDELYLLTHQATERLNLLQEEFLYNNSEIETAARECLALDFRFIAEAYGFEADIETLIAPREW